MGVSLGASRGDTGCCLVLISLGANHDIIAYRRDAEYPADIKIEKTRLGGYNAIHQYKTKNGYFNHLIITENGWMIGIGGRDNETINKKLEKLGIDITSKKRIEEKDMEQANKILKENGWGFFIIKSPDGNVGLTSYDGRIGADITKISKMKEGEYIKITNNPNYYQEGMFEEFDSDPLNAAFEIAATDTFGLNRRDIITYEYRQGEVKVWASFDGGTLVEGTFGSPDNIIFLGRKIDGGKLPRIPHKIFLGNETFKEKSKKPSIPSTLTPWIIVAVGLIIVFAVHRKMKAS